MKIGILTFHRAHNYGAVLQCYALQEILQRLGYDVYVIDYRQPTLEYAYKYWNFRTILESLRSPKLLFKYQEVCQNARRQFVFLKIFRAS